jgi:glutathione peroxidase
MTTLHDFSATTISGKAQALSDFGGKAVLVVNVASACGYTPQYAGLEALHRELGARGFEVLGFPCNDFGAQEPGTEADIQSFCTTRFGVTFPLFSKITVKGNGKDPLYAWLTTASSPPGEVRWNFEKFLIGKDGALLGRFGSGVAPESAELRAAIDRALAAT